MRISRDKKNWKQQSLWHNEISDISVTHSLEMVTVMVLIPNSPPNQFTLSLLKTVRVLGVILSDERVVRTLKQTHTYTHARLLTRDWIQGRSVSDARTQDACYWQTAVE